MLNNNEEKNERESAEDVTDMNDETHQNNEFEEHPTSRQPCICRETQTC